MDYSHYHVASWRDGQYRPVATNKVGIVVVHDGDNTSHAYRIPPGRSAREVADWFCAVHEDGRDRAYRVTGFGTMYRLESLGDGEIETNDLDFNDDGAMTEYERRLDAWRRAG